MANTSGAGNLADLFKTFGPALFGTGTTTSTSTPDAGALATSRGIASQALSNADNAESATNDIVNRIITKNANAFGPVAAGARTAGLYNDTVLKQLSSEAQANSTAEASKAVLDFKTQQLGIAQNATASQLAATRTTTSATAPQVPSSITSMLGLGLGGISAYKNRNDILDFFGLTSKDAPDSKLLDPITGKEAASGDALSPAASQSQTNAAFGDTSASTTVQSGPQELGTTIGSGSEATTVAEDGGGTFAAAPAEETATAATTDAADAATTTDALTGIDAADEGALIDAGTGEVATDAGVAIGEGVAEEIGTDAAVELGTEVAADGALEAVGVAAAPETFGLSLLAVPILSAIFGDSSIICAELKRQGRLSDSLARRSLTHFSKYKEVSREAYYIWARPSVKHLQTYPESLYSKSLAVLFNYRSQHLVSKNLLTYGAYYLVSAITVACWPLLKLRQATDSRKMMDRYLKHLYRSF